MSSSDLLQILEQSPHHLLVRIETIHLPSEADYRIGDALATIEGLVADAPRSRQTRSSPRFEPGDKIRFFLEPCVPENRHEFHVLGATNIFSDDLKERALVEVILDDRLFVAEGLIESVDDHPEDPRYNEFGAFHG